jgi:hypothetical protein
MCCRWFTYVLRVVDTVIVCVLYSLCLGCLCWLSLWVTHFLWFIFFFSSCFAFFFLLQFGYWFLISVLPCLGATFVIVRCQFPLQKIVAPCCSFVSSAKSVAYAVSSFHFWYCIALYIVLIVTGLFSWVFLSVCVRVCVLVCVCVCVCFCWLYMPLIRSLSFLFCALVLLLHHQV